MSQDPTHTIMRADYLLAAALFVSTEETRYYLNGIYTEPHQAGGAVCVATEGHGLGCVYDDEGYCHNPQGVWHTSAITALKNLMTAAKKHRPPAGNLYAELKHTEATTSVTLWQADCVQSALKRTLDAHHLGVTTDKTFWVDGTFPEWRRVTAAFMVHEKDPEPGPALLPAGINARYLKRFGDFAKLISGEAGAPVIPVAIGPGYRLLIDSHPHAMAITMEMRAGLSGSEIEAVPWLIAMDHVPELTVKKKAA